MPLTSTVGKKLTLYFCTTVIKRSPPSSPPPSDDLHRPILSSSLLPLYKKKITSLAFPYPLMASISKPPSTSPPASTFECADIEVEASSPDFSSIYTSTRFFVSSPGLSNSILECSPSSNDVVEEGDCVKGEVEVQMESSNPYLDFRRSMEEMVEAREFHNVPANWESLQMLLSRYLSLNPEPNHKFIVSAFADLLVSLMTTNGSSI